MQINELSLENFRCFGNLQISFTPHFNVMIGDNGVGKTTVLDALAVGVSAFLLGIDSQMARGIHSNDVKQVTYQSRDIIANELVFPVRIRCRGKIADRDIEWGRSLLGKGRRTTQKDAKELMGIAEGLQEQVREQQEVSLPLIAYYDIGRLWFHTEWKSRQPNSTSANSNPTPAP